MPRRIPAFTWLKASTRPSWKRIFQQVAARVSSSVVAISATEDPFDADLGSGADDINPAKLAGLLDTVDRTVGTGFIFDSDGYIVTNDHVVAKAQQLWVTTDSHKIYPAIVVSSDPRADLAVLKIPAKYLPVARFARKSAVRGQWTLSIGNPYGLASGGEMAVSVGIVSATNRSLPR
jgi:S1-C subfamily serine protease